MKYLRVTLFIIIFFMLTGYEKFWVEHFSIQEKRRTKRNHNEQNSQRQKNISYCKEKGGVPILTDYLWTPQELQKLKDCKFSINIEINHDKK